MRNFIIVTLLLLIIITTFQFCNITILQVVNFIADITNTSQINNTLKEIMSIDNILNTIGNLPVK